MKLIRLSPGILLLVMLLAACLQSPSNGTEPEVALLMTSSAPDFLESSDLPEMTNTPGPGLPPTAVVVPDTGWEVLRAGLERRIINLEIGPDTVHEKLYLVRVNPEYFRFDIGYRPGNPLDLVSWQVETGALLVINGGYFTETYEATGLVVADGIAYGTSYRGFGGMLTIDGQGPELRQLAQRPYNPAEYLLGGLQSFPMLVLPDQQAGYVEEGDLPSRRTVIGQDHQGRFIFLVASSGTFTLAELSLFLLGSDLDLRLALNLDGGSSSGILLADPVEGVLPFSLLPTVITVFAR